MKKSRSFFLILLPLLFLYTGCGDEFGSMSVYSEIYFMFPGIVPEKIFVAFHGSTVDNEAEKLSSSMLNVKEDFIELQQICGKTEFIKLYKKEIEKPEIYIGTGSQQLQTRRNYMNKITLTFSDSYGSEKTSQTITIPYLEGGGYRGSDVIFRTQNYGDIQALFVYYFIQSI